jgi:hypothetical protein
MTIAAPSLQQKIADQRKIIVKFDRFFALRTVRTGGDDRLLLGKPNAADIQETTHYRPENN